MLELLGAAFSSIVGGGMTGILGVVVQRIADFKNKQLDLQLNKQKYEYELTLRKVDAEIMAHEWAGRTKVAEVEASGREAVADSQAFAASFNEPQRYSDPSRANNTQTWLLVILDFIRGIVRPGLTIYLCVITTLIYFQARELLGSSIPEEHAYEILKTIIGTILYLTTTCLLWWFGSRNKQPAPKIK